MGSKGSNKYSNEVYHFDDSHLFMIGEMRRMGVGFEKPVCLPSVFNLFDGESRRDWVDGIVSDDLAAFVNDHHILYEESGDRFLLED